MATDNFLQVSPPELKFRFELRKNIPITLTLQNPTGERVAFKVKTTSPKKYCVRPSSGIVEPNGSSSVQVIMQAQREQPPSFQDCKDKFLVQCVRVGAGAKEVESDMFGAGKDVRQTKLRVVLLTPPKPPSPVPEGTEEPNSPASSAFQPVVSAAGASTGGGGGGGAAAEKLDIKRRLDMLEEAPGGAAPRAAGRKAVVRVGGYTVMHLFVVAVLAFIIGQITQFVVLPRVFGS